MSILRKDQPDAVWHVTSRVNWQAWHLRSDRSYHVFRRAFEDATELFGVDVLAFVVMSNHYHAVLRSPTDDEYGRLTSRRTSCRHRRPWPHKHPKSTVIGQCVRRLKRVVSLAIQDDLGVTGHFWEGRHHRRRLCDPSAMVTAIAYDHRNPVRAGMVRHAHEHERSSAAWWLDASTPPVPLCRRADLPFDVTPQSVRREVLRLHGEARLDEAMEAFHRTRLRIDSECGLRRFRECLNDAGIVVDLECGSAAAVVPR